MRYLSLFLSLVILSSCIPIEETDDVASPDTEEKQIIFFSNDDNMRSESNYYDALLELKAKFPVEISNMKIVSSEDDRNYTEYDIKEYPSLIIVKNNEIIKKIEGYLAKEKILDPIEEVLSN